MKYIVLLLALAVCSGCSTDLDRSKAEARIKSHLSDIRIYTTLEGGNHLEQKDRCNPEGTAQSGLVRYIPDGYEIPDGYKTTRVSCNYQQLYPQELIVHAERIPNTQEFQLTTIAGNVDLVSVTGITQQDGNTRRVEFQFKETYASNGFKQLLQREEGIQAGVAQFRRYDDGWRMVSIDAGVPDHLTARPKGNGDLDAYIMWSDSIDFDKMLTEYSKEVEWRSGEQYQEMVQQTQYFDLGVLRLKTHTRWGPIIRLKGNWRTQCDAGVIVRSPNTSRDGIDCAGISGKHAWFQVRSDSEGIFGLCLHTSYDKEEASTCSMLNNSNVELYIDQWKLLSNPPRDQWIRLPLSNEWSPFRPNIPTFAKRNDSWTEFAWRGCGELCDVRNIFGSHKSDIKTATNVQFKGQGFVEFCYYSWRLGSGPRDICRDPAPMNDAELSVAQAARAPSNSVSDAQTGLSWAPQDNGSDIDWNAAGNHCATLGGDWALPTVADLQGLYDASATLTQIRMTGGGLFWSGESNGSSEAWTVSLTNRTRNSITVDEAHHIRALCVRRSSTYAPRPATPAVSSTQRRVESPTSVKFRAENPGDSLLPSGVRFSVIEIGSGAQPRANSEITVHYRGSVASTGMVFDDSFARGKPVTFRLNQVIQGWQDALVRMHVGDTWKVYIPPEKAYGAQGQGKIGPNEALVFDIQLINVK